MRNSFFSCTKLLTLHLRSTKANKSYCNIHAFNNHLRPYFSTLQNTFVLQNNLCNSYHLSSRLCTNLKKCSECYRNIDSLLICYFCHTIQKIETSFNYFDIMGMDRTYDLDSTVLKHNFLQLQSQLHPDKYSNKSEDEKSLSEEYSSLINNAYKTLQNPLERGKYLLELSGITFGNNSNQIDHNFLITMMEFNEQLENANSVEKVLHFEAQNNEKIELISRRVGEAFASNNLQAAKNGIEKMQYYCSNDIRIKQLKSNLNIVD